MESAESHAHQTGMDRRVARTRRALQHAFLQLILDKGYEAVSIQDICDAADVGRSTFYLHFKDKDDLKRSGLDHLRRNLTTHRERTSQKATQRALDFSRPMFEHARDHLHIYRALAGSAGGGVALDTIRDILGAQLKSDPLILSEPPGYERELKQHFFLGAFMSVLVWWLDQGATIDIDIIDRKFRDLAGFE